jgi:hypothetical protein
MPFGGSTLSSAEIPRVARWVSRVALSRVARKMPATDDQLEVFERVVPPVAVAVMDLHARRNGTVFVGPDATVQ